MSLGSSKTIAVNQLLRPYPQFTERLGVHNERIVDLPLVPGAVDAPLHAWRQLDLGVYVVEVAGRDAVPEPQRSAAVVWTFGERPHLPVLDRRHLSAAVWSGSRLREQRRRGLADHRRMAGAGRLPGAERTAAGVRSASLQTSGTSLPVFLGPGNPGSSAWGRNGFKNSSNGTWFNTSQLGDDTLAAARRQASSPGLYGTQYQIRTLPIRFGTLRSDFLNQLDAAVQRNFSLSKLYEPLALQIRLDLVNALNHPVLGGSGPNHTVVTDWTSSTFGQVTAQENQPRIYQFEAFIRF